MSESSKIEWTDATWNVITGCTRVSEGCRNCYAERLAATRLAHVPAYEGVAEMTPAGPRWTGLVRFNADRLSLPLRWTKPRRVFVNSQSDLFHEGLTNEQIAAVFGVMAACSRHTFQVLTKRPERMREWLEWMRGFAMDQRDLAAAPSLRQTCMKAAFTAMGETTAAKAKLDPYWMGDGDGGPWPLPNVWLGCSIEDQATADARIPVLLECPAAVRWVSAEPLLAPVDLARWAYLPRRVAGDWPIGHKIQAGPGIVRGQTNPFGAWSVLTDDGEWLGVRPGEFEERRLDWVVAGGESGPGARPMHPEWARSLREQCAAAEVAFLFKQWGEWAPNCLCDKPAACTTTPRPTPGKMGVMFRCGKHAAGRMLDGREWSEYPEAVAS